MTRAFLLLVGCLAGVGISLAAILFVSPAPASPPAVDLRPAIAHLDEQLAALRVAIAPPSCPAPAVSLGTGISNGGPAPAYEPGSTEGWIVSPPIVQQLPDLEPGESTTFSTVLCVDASGRVQPCGDGRDGLAPGSSP